MQAESQPGAEKHDDRHHGEVCAHCGGTGWRIVADGGNGSAQPCDCRKRRIGAELLAAAGIPDRHRACRLDNFRTSNRTASPAVHAAQLGAKRKSEQYVESFLDPATGKARAAGLIYIGPPGTGKTHLAAAVLTALIERYGVRGRFVNFSHLIYEIQSTFDPQVPQTKRQLLDRVTGAEVLVLDELGATKPTEWVQDTLYLLINERYGQNLPTIFTTNYHLDDVATRRARASDAAAEGPHASSDAMAAHDLGREPARGLGKTMSRAMSRPMSRPTSRPTSRPAPMAPSAAAPGRYEALASRISPVLVSRLYEMAQPVPVGNWDYRHHVMMPRRRAGA